MRKRREGLEYTLKYQNAMVRQVHLNLILHFIYV